ncbi:hypothetical protein ACFL2T_07275 [Elusimicrobiota bacterium]
MKFRNRRDQSGRQDPWNTLVQRFEQFEELGVLSNDPTALSDVASLLDPEDVEARKRVDARLAVHQILNLIAPDPFPNRPKPGEVDGKYRFATVDGDIDNAVGLDEGHLNLSMTVCGQAGFGKTNFVIGLLLTIMEAE